ncbi:hypothetical protein GCK32_012020 [Trichostrongylus colubriformis]|uniref:Uncharacterized protein n=1 Tax=Trichostrongylus colubriformis TaxID=6319 RepID=A0AAN8FRG7_TRICO
MKLLALACLLVCVLTISAQRGMEEEFGGMRIGMEGMSSPLPAGGMDEMEGFGWPIGGFGTHSAYSIVILPKYNVIRFLQNG